MFRTVVGVNIPQSLLDCMAKTTKASQPGAGIRIYREVSDKAHEVPGVSVVHIIVVHQEEALSEIVTRAGYLLARLYPAK